MYKYLETYHLDKKIPPARWHKISHSGNKKDFMYTNMETIEI